MFFLLYVQLKSSDFSKASINPDGKQDASRDTGDCCSLLGATEKWLANFWNCCGVVTCFGRRTRVTWKFLCSKLLPSCSQVSPAWWDARGYPEDSLKINICLDPRVGLDGTEEAEKGW